MMNVERYALSSAHSVSAMEAGIILAGNESSDPGEKGYCFDSGLQGVSLIWVGFLRFETTAASAACYAY